ncbi:hypothetical protein DS745_23205 [Anaerobacillus alkaliphilus]|uniref:Uncharacterized protein n=1 Tax=Anaerobacillus alkaliphilus TaxID=1548597 RepID=A0A4Q0VMP5_9BACI|nr:hypothetical protein [Anaerobacillus alkaliphilus]RXI96611.1 hypothetical protein DS745_23205 [Anaerobacillus alkaliphilus]
MNDALKQIFDEDQHDLQTMPENRVERDRERRMRVKAIIEGGGATEAIDFIHAAIVFQHGETLDDWWEAYQFSLKAVDMGFQPKWLAAVALDRWLVRQGKPLKYGNQIVPFGGIYRIPKLDPATTDVEREKWDVPSFNELHSFENLRGFVSCTVVDTTEIIDFKVKIVNLERLPAHSPTLIGAPIGTDARNQIILENSYGWKWIEDHQGSFKLGWLLLPHVPTIAHPVVCEGNYSIEKITLSGHPCVTVSVNESHTIYFKTSKGIWAVTGRDINDVIHKTKELMLEDY